MLSALPHTTFNSNKHYLFQDEVNEVRSGQECGLMVDNDQVIVNFVDILYKKQLIKADLITRIYEFEKSKKKKNSHLIDLFVAYQ